MPNLTFGSMFSGIGGLDLGLERAGMECRWQVEVDPFCTAVLRKHWPDVSRYGDIKELRGDELEPVDLICGGFPCQPVSHAGLRRGKDDDRYLWPEMLRLVGTLRPRFVLGENVFGLVTHEQGALLATVLTDLEAAGYEVAPPLVFPAAAVGALHRRDRVWVLAHARHDRGSAEQGDQQGERPEVADRGSADQGWAAADSYERRERPQGTLQAGRVAVGHGARWDTEPGVRRVVDGIPNPMDRTRLHALGNAVVPQVAEWLGRRILALGGTNA